MTRSTPKSPQRWSAWLVALVDLILYSNLFIAIGAMALIWEWRIIQGTFRWDDPLAWMVLCSTLCVYSLHRLLGLDRASPSMDTRRWSVIRKFRSHIRAYGTLSLIGIVLLVPRLPAETLVLLGMAALPTFLYLAPIFKGGRRLRDLAYAKIFLIGLVWAWVTILVPAASGDTALSWSLLLPFGEKFCFIVAITIPFDIRDMAVDRRQSVRTIPIALGVRKSAVLAQCLLAIAVLLTALSLFFDLYPLRIAIAIGLSYVITMILVSRATLKLHDYYFSAMIDGVIVLQFIFVLLATVVP